MASSRQYISVPDTMFTPLARSFWSRKRSRKPRATEPAFTELRGRLLAQAAKREVFWTNGVKASPSVDGDPEGMAAASPVLAARGKHATAGDQASH
jgi:hypothetical protein